MCICAVIYCDPVLKTTLKIYSQHNITKKCLKCGHLPKGETEAGQHTLHTDLELFTPIPETIALGVFFKQ